MRVESTALEVVVLENEESLADDHNHTGTAPQSASVNQSCSAYEHLSLGSRMDIQWHEQTSSRLLCSGWRRKNLLQNFQQVKLNGASLAAAMQRAAILPLKTGTKKKGAGR